MKYTTHSEEETASFGFALGNCLKKGDTVLLSGDLGAGKSVLARGIARAKGVRGAMASPTFTLMQPYEGTEKVYHFDLYRLADADELYAAGLDEYIGTDGIALVEWPIEDTVAPPYVEIHLKRGEDDAARTIEIRTCGMEERARAIATALSAWEDTE